MCAVDDGTRSSLDAGFREDLEDDMGAGKGVRCECMLGALGQI